MSPLHTPARPINFSGSGPYFAALFLLAIVAFWPSYLSPAAAPSSGYTHFHAVTASLWMVMLVIQPMAIRARRLLLHRLIGRVSYVIGPLVPISMLLLAHNRIRTASPTELGLQTYLLYLQLSLAFVFGLSYAAAIYKRRDAAVHARFMVCTALTLIDPIVARLLFRIDPTISWNLEWATFGLADLLLIVLIWRERSSPRGRAVFPGMLVVFVVTQAPALFELTQKPSWQSFARWFASLAWT